ncbi:amidase signature enzyme [Atractiella rhizophila]|nr:amidase signature enzyme [Atractiella rhizophila]
MPTTCSSEMLRDYVSPYDSTVLSLLMQEGASILGKTNMDEFGMGSYNMHSIFGSAKNPVSNEVRVAGGSSGGAAAAVAARMVDVAITSDTGGSTRLPASYCNIFGFKPTYGLLSRWGMIAYASSLDCVGIMAADVDKVLQTFESLEVWDEKDSTSVPESTRRLVRQLREDPVSLAGLRIGVPREFFAAEISPDALVSFSSFLHLLEQAGCEIVSVSHQSARYALSSYYVIASAEASSNLAKYDGIEYGYQCANLPEEELANGQLSRRAVLYGATRRGGFGDEVRKRILLGTHALSADAFENYFLQAQAIRKRIVADYNSLFASPHFLLSSSESSDTTASSAAPKVDFLLHLSAISSAPLLSDCRDPKQSTSQYIQDMLTVPASLAGLPAISLPFGQSAADGQPIGFQLVGQWGHDHRVLNFSKILAELYYSSKDKLS